MSTPYHAAFFAHELTRRSSSDNLEKLGVSMMTATVDLNPHQLDAALFAFRSPLSRGAILADEVGLGKTIEAGLIISQLWAERKRRILIIAPTMLRKQWAQELLDKFHIRARVLDSREYNLGLKRGETPLEPDDHVVICSYHFARAKANEIRAIRWDLVVIDEAHRLRNVYKASNKIANAIRNAVHTRPMLLLTATPLQNSLLELYGLVRFIDERLFGDINTFRARYMRGATAEREYADLRARLLPICRRTLRKQVLEYVKFTRRIAITQDFTPTEGEQRLYDLVSSYLQRESLNALPSSQRKLMTLVLRKLLASSTFAIAGTLKRLAERLRRAAGDDGEEIEAAIAEDYEGYGELEEEWKEGEENEEPENPQTAGNTALQQELRDLLDYHSLAESITENAKGKALLEALQNGFARLAELGANRKAVIFTESRRTQEYLFGLLNDSGYEGRVMTLNGTNTDPRSAAIYDEWVRRHQGEDVVTGNKQVDLRAALVEHFRDHADILIATEAAAEGVNLQFCSLVVNYDLPWNPQRIEQRIGRCHRYGQKYDVVVINFLNRGNAADRRVFELLEQKFQLFEGVFGASDEVLGALESGVDFERRIAEIYQLCRTNEEIEYAFTQLRQELEEEIAARMQETRRNLIEHFDEEVHQRFRNIESGKEFLKGRERALWRLTRYELENLGVTDFDEADCAFSLHRQLPEPAPEVEEGVYVLVRRDAELKGRHPYRLGDPLADYLIELAKNRPLEPALVRFDQSAHTGRIGMLDELSGRSGWMEVRRLTVSALEEEDHLLCAVIADDGQRLHPDTCEKLFRVTGEVIGAAAPSAEVLQELEEEIRRQQAEVLDGIHRRNTEFFEDESEKLDRWADDLKFGLEAELKELDREIQSLKRSSRLAQGLEEKLELHRRAKDLEAERSRKRRLLFDEQDKIDRERERLLEETAERLKQDVGVGKVLIIQWTVQ